MQHARFSRIGETIALAAAFAAADLASAQYVMFAPGTDEAYKQQVLDFVQARYDRLGIDRYSLGARWADGGNNGDPIVITYSLAPDGFDTLPGAQPGATPAELPSENVLDAVLTPLFGGGDLGRAMWISIVEDAFVQLDGVEPITGFFKNWGNISGIAFNRVVDPNFIDPEGNPQATEFDNGDPWGTDGPLTGGVTGLGDIRIAMKFIDGFGGVMGYSYPPDDPNYPGEIVLDSSEEWTKQDVNFRFMKNAIAHHVGIACGLLEVCPEIRQKLMEPFDIQFPFTGPQVDDIRGIQALYGDYLENDDERSTAVATDIKLDLTEALLGFQAEFTTLSIDESTDEDAFYFVIPDLGQESVEFDVRITVNPTGTTYDVGDTLPGGNCGGADVTPIPAQSIRDLRIAIVDVDDLPLPAFDVSGDPPLPVTPDGDGFYNTKMIGFQEKIQATVTDFGTYFIVVGGAPGGFIDPTQPQQYDIKIEIGDLIVLEGISPAVVIKEPVPFGMNAGVLNDITGDILPEGFPVYRGRLARVGNIESQHPWDQHETTFHPPSLLFPVQDPDYPPMFIGWPGNAISPPAVNTEGQHATQVVSMAIGTPNPNGVFGGAAWEASWFSAAVGTHVFLGGSFLTSRESLAYALFGLAHPDVALSLGLPEPATVLNSSWGAGGDLRGDSLTSHMYDACVVLTGVTSIASAGNSGGIDRTAQCGGTNQNVPGGIFRGSRTVGFPATAFNTISVGMCGKELMIEDGQTPADVNPALEPYVLVSDRSSKGPVDSFDFDTSITQFNSRPGVDLISIGTGYVVEGQDPLGADPVQDACAYMGHPSVVLIELPKFNPLSPDPAATIASFGTSFAGPAVVGGVALLQDFALSQDPPLSTHPAVIRAILMTSANKFIGWSNSGNPARPQDNRDGQDIDEDSDAVTRTATQAVDSAQGAGFCDLGRAYEVYRGRYFDPLLSFLVPGAPSTDVALTDPTIPMIMTPPNEVDLILPIPVAASAGPESVDDLPPTPIQIARTLAMAREGSPENPVFSYHSHSFGDPDIGNPDGDKSAAGLTFSDRVPFFLPPSPDRPGFNTADPPVEIPSGTIGVAPIGWDHGNIGQRVLRLPQNPFFQGGGFQSGYIDYFIEYAFDGVSDTLTATLCWNRNVEMDIPDFSNPDDPQIGEIETLELEDLILELIQTDATGAILDDHVFLGIVGQDDGGQVWANSDSKFNNVEHIHTRSPGKADIDDIDIVIPSGFYLMRVRWVAQEYDLFLNQPQGEVEYGLAWRVEPTAGSTQRPPLVAKATSAGGSQLLRVFTMYINAFGTQQGDTNFDPSFDLNRDGSVDSLDFAPVITYWSARG